MALQTLHHILVLADDLDETKKFSIKDKTYNSIEELVFSIIDAEKPDIKTEDEATNHKAKKDANESVRRYSAKALAKIGGPTAFQPLADYLNDPSSYVRYEAVQDLSRYQDPRVKALLRRVEDYQDEMSVYRFGDVELDFHKFESRKEGLDLGLTPLELLAAILYARASVFCRVKE